MDPRGLLPGQSKKKKSPPDSMRDPCLKKTKIIGTNDSGDISEEEAERSKEPEAEGYCRITIFWTQEGIALRNSQGAGLLPV